MLPALLWCVLSSSDPGVAQAAVPPPAASMQPAASLLEVLPAGTASLWHRRAGSDTALVDGYAREVVQAAIGTRFDQLLLETLEAAEVDPELVRQLASLRNMLGSVGAAVPWHQLLGREFVWAHTMTPPLAADIGLPSALLAVRPDPDRARELETALAGAFGATAAFLSSYVLYDIETLPDAHGGETRIYRLGVPMFGDVALISLAARDGLLLLGLGEEYFRAAVELMRGASEGRRLVSDPRFERAFEGLPTDAPSHSFLDVPLLLAAAEDAGQVLAEHDLRSGLLQGMLNETLDLVQHVDTVASASHLEGTDLVTETFTRLDAERMLAAPLAGAGTAQRASGELLAYVPADVVSFSLRGPIDLRPLYSHVQQRLIERWSWAEDALWAFHVLEAAADLSIERDLLSWLGAEHITLAIPSRQKFAGPQDLDTVLVCRVGDPLAARKSLARAEGIVQAAAPRLMGGLQDLVRQLAPAYVPELTIGAATGGLPGLSRLTLSAGEVRLSLDYGVVGQLLLASTSENALMTCMMVAAGEEPGLEERDDLAGLLGRTDLCSARLQPHGRELAATAETLLSIGPMLRSWLGPQLEGSPGFASGIGLLGEVCARLGNVLAGIDFVGDGLTTSELREQGLVYYERSVLHLLSREARPSAGVAANTSAAGTEPTPAGRQPTR